MSMARLVVQNQVPDANKAIKYHTHKIILLIIISLSVRD